MSQPSYVYDANGQQIATFREFDLSIPMTKEDIPQVLKDAVVAAEDRKFWTHKGIDPEGLVRAAITNYREGETVQGGSTITQQYVKNTYLTNERSVERKLNEAVLATRLERDLTDELGSQRAAKEEILYRYLNTVYFGDGAYGAAAAAQSYFRKDVKDLNVVRGRDARRDHPVADALRAPREPVRGRGASHRRARRDARPGHDQRRRVRRRQGALPVADRAGRPGQADHAGAGGPPDNGAAQYPYFVDYVRTLPDRQVRRPTARTRTLYRGGLQHPDHRSTPGCRSWPTRR